MPEIRIDLGQRSYSVRVGAGVLGDIGRLVTDVASAKNVAVVADSNVARIYGPRVIDSLSVAGVAATMIEFPAGECNKTIGTYAAIFDGLFAIRPAVDRHTVIVALGGGVAGDIAGFVAATALRGIRFVQCPTSLLADVDASVGGKTGVDHAAGKNLIGAFHQPSAVLIDVDTLRTLPANELSSGLAECVKHAVIRDASLLDFLEQNAAKILAIDSATMTQLVTWNVRIKAAVVSADERETGQRAHLNFGHTIGHAVETALGFGKITHGQAVALGMIAANNIAVDRKLLSVADADRVRSVIAAIRLPTGWQGLKFDELLKIMQHDKKNRDGKIRFVLPTKIGQVGMFNDVTPGAIQKAIAAISV